eukprot:COSAG01_NODE_1472_length_10197_cov_4.374431_5_plen_242_part_00
MKIMLLKTPADCLNRLAAQGGGGWSVASGDDPTDLAAVAATAVAQVKRDDARVDARRKAAEAAAVAAAASTNQYPHSLGDVDASVVERSQEFAVRFQEMSADQQRTVWRFQPAQPGPASQETQRAMLPSLEQYPRASDPRAPSEWHTADRPVVHSGQTQGHHHNQEHHPQARRQPPGGAPNDATTAHAQRAFAEAEAARLAAESARARAEATAEAARAEAVAGARRLQSEREGRERDLADA